MKRRQPTPEQALQAIYLNRLQRLVHDRRVFETDLNPWALRMVDNAIRATLIDCEEAGVGVIARKLLPARKHE